jgi:hypothetical protein
MELFTPILLTLVEFISANFTELRLGSEYMGAALAFSTALGLLVVEVTVRLGFMR